MATPFQPQPAKTVSIDVSGTSQRVAIAGAPGSVRVMNNGTATVWINHGDVEVTAALATGMPVGPGVTEVLSFPNGTAVTFYIAAIAEGATGEVYFTPGSGI
jgi:hypothetical protein